MVCKGLNLINLINLKVRYLLVLGNNSKDKVKKLINESKLMNKVINIISYTFLVIIVYLFPWDLRVSDIFQIFIFSIISFSISNFISDNFKLSNIKFIKILQKLVIYFLGFLFWGILTILYWLRSSKYFSNIAKQNSNLLKHYLFLS